MKNWITLIGVTALLLGGCASRASFEGASGSPGGRSGSITDTGRAAARSAAQPTVAPGTEPDADSNAAPDAGLDQPAGPPRGLVPRQVDPNDSKPEFILPRSRNEVLSI